MTRSVDDFVVGFEVADPLAVFQADTDPVGLVRIVEHSYASDI